MPDITALIQSGATNPWFYLPLAVVLGALHALEPGHSKSMMAAFIIAVRGTARQAALLGLSAAVGHTIIVWAIAALGLYLGDRLILGKAEPWLVLVSGALIMALAVRIFFMLRVEQGHGHEHHQHQHHHDHDHGHHHHHGHHSDFDGDHRPSHGMSNADFALDSHAAEHAREIREHFEGRKSVSNFDIVWFGFTGGLMPCPAAVAVLLICLQMRAFTLGIGMVAGFSVGLAITLVLVGVAAAWGANAARARWAGLDRWGERLPYISAAIVMTIGLLIVLRGLWELGVIA